MACRGLQVHLTIGQFARLMLAQGLLTPVAATQLGVFLVLQFVQPGAVLGVAHVLVVRLRLARQRPGQTQQGTPVGAQCRQLQVQALVLAAQHLALQAHAGFGMYRLARRHDPLQGHAQPRRGAQPQAQCLMACHQGLQAAMQLRQVDRTVQIECQRGGRQARLPAQALLR